jgi:hypothetical protein
MDEMMLDKDEQRRDRVMRTTLKMKKLDVAELERAYRG